MRHPSGAILHLQLKLICLQSTSNGLEDLRVQCMLWRVIHLCLRQLQPGSLQDMLCLLIVEKDLCWGNRLFGGVWNAAEKWRFGFFLRRYHAADSSQHVHLERAASHLAALMLLALPEVSVPPKGVHGSVLVSFVSPEVLILLAGPEGQRGLIHEWDLIDASCWAGPLAAHA